MKKITWLVKPDYAKHVIGTAMLLLITKGGANGTAFIKFYRIYNRLLAWVNLVSHAYNTCNSVFIRREEVMNLREHKEQIIQLLQEILAEPNARIAAQHKLYIIKASMLTKRK